MSNKIKIFTILLAFSFIILPFSSLKAESMAQQQSGMILLQVQAQGQAWYVYPTTLTRFYLATPADCFNVMRSLGLGVSNANMNSYNGYAPASLSGMILLQVQAQGQAYYVYPPTLKMYYLGTPTACYNAMRSLGLGITNSNLAQIPVDPNSANSNAPTPAPAPSPAPIPTPSCNPNCSCASNTCQGLTCSDGCGGTCSGAKLCGNPASNYCSQNGGQDINQTGYSGVYGVCVFSNNMQCGDWAMYNRQCPIGGVNVSGYSNQQAYCAINGGTVNVYTNTCTVYGGSKMCTVSGYWQYGTQCPPYNTCIPNCSCSSYTCQGSSCSDGCGGTCSGQKNCCTPNCSCASYTCQGSTCSNGCGGYCNGTKSCGCTPNCSCAAYTCTGSTCSNGCGGTCSGQKYCCTPNCSCASNTCQGSTCSDGCGGTCDGQKLCGNPAAVFCTSHGGTIVGEDCVNGSYVCDQWYFYQTCKGSWSCCGQLPQGDQQGTAGGGGGLLQ